jgi:hypothetical protein
MGRRRDNVLKFGFLFLFSQWWKNNAWILFVYLLAETLRGAGGWEGGHIMVTGVVGGGGGEGGGRKVDAKTHIIRRVRERKSIPKYTAQYILYTGFFFVGSRIG